MFATHGVLGILEDQIQLYALAFMAVMYTIKIVLLFRLTAASERTPPQGDPGAGIRYSFLTIANPWGVLSARKHWWRYVEFVVFHLSVAVVITLSLIIPYATGIIKTADGATTIIGAIAQVFAIAGCLVAVSRLVRRISDPAMREISSPDDYFSVGVLAVYLLVAFLCFTAYPAEWARYAFFGMTTFFLIYVPFSKISHYVLWPFARYYLGKHWGRRGVYPKRSAAHLA